MLPPPRIDGELAPVGGVAAALRCEAGTPGGPPQAG